MYRDAVMIRTNLRDKYNAMDVVQKTGVKTMAIGVARKCIRHTYAAVYTDQGG